MNFVKMVEYKSSDEFKNIAKHLAKGYLELIAEQDENLEKNWKIKINWKKKENTHYFIMDSNKFILMHKLYDLLAIKYPKYYDAENNCLQSNRNFIFL